MTAVFTSGPPSDLQLTRQPSRGSTYPPPSISHGRISPPLRSRPVSSAFKRSFSPPPSGRRPKSFLARLRPSSTASDLPAPTHPRAKRASAFALPSATGAVRRSLDEKARTRHGSVPAISVVAVHQEEEEDVTMDWEAEWERVRTLPRVRLIPPEDEGEPVTLYPMPHPRLPLPFLEGAFSQPSLLNTSLAASLISHASLPSPTAESQPPESPMSNRRGAAVAGAAGTEHHWKSMVEGFVLPPPMFSRHGLPAAGTRVVMPKTKKQVEADLGRRVSMVMAKERNRGSLEVKREDIMFIQHALEQGCQTSPPPLGEGRPTSPPLFFSPPSIPLRPATPTPTSPGADEASESPPWNLNGVLGIDPFPQIDTRCAIAALAETDATKEDGGRSEALTDDLDAVAPALPRSRESVGFDRTMVASPTSLEKDERLGWAAMLDLAPSSSPSAATQMERQHSDDQADQPPRKKRAKSLSSALAWPLKSINTNAPPPLPPLPPAPSGQKTIRKQKSLKQLFFPTDTPAPPLPPLPPASHAADQPPLPPVGASTPGGKAKTLLSRAASKPALKIDTTATASSSLGGEPSAQSTAVSTAKSDPYPATPKTPAAIAEEGSKPGLIKRFSLSNMSSAFRRKSSVATLSDIGLPTASDKVPEVPTIPAQFLQSKRSKSTPAPADSAIAPARPVPCGEAEAESSGRPFSPPPQADARRKSDELVIDLRNYSKTVYRRSSEPVAEPTRDQPPPPPVPTVEKRKSSELVIDLRQSSRSPPLFRPPSAPRPDSNLPPPLPDGAGTRGSLLPAAFISERRASSSSGFLPPSPATPADVVVSSPLTSEQEVEQELDIPDDESIAMSLDTEDGELWIMEAPNTHLSPRHARPSEMSLSRWVRNPSIPFTSPWDRHIPQTAATMIPLPCSPTSSPTILPPASPSFCAATSSVGAAPLSPRAAVKQLSESPRMSMDSTTSSSSSSAEDPTPTTPSMLGLSNVPAPPTPSLPLQEPAASLTLPEPATADTIQEGEVDGDSIVIVSPVTSPIKSPPTRTQTPRGGGLARFSPEVLTRWRKLGNVAKASPRSVPLPLTPEEQVHQITAEKGTGTGGSLQGDVQLNSLHFEELGLDFAMDEPLDRQPAAIIQINTYIKP